MSEDGNNYLMEINPFIRICHYLPTGMILRCAAVCQHWNELCGSDDLWIMILGTELREESGLSLYANIRLNREIANLWKREFCEAYPNACVKNVYMNLRRNKIKQKEKLHPGYKKKVRIFPYESDKPLKPAKPGACRLYTTRGAEALPELTMKTIEMSTGDILRFLNSA